VQTKVLLKVIHKVLGKDSENHRVIQRNSNGHWLPGKNAGIEKTGQRGYNRRDSRWD
jgi:hypothetical protein